MIASLLLLVFLGPGHPAGPAATLVIGAVVCCAAAMGGDNLQDLKTGHLVGAMGGDVRARSELGHGTTITVTLPAA